jgi:methylmalonyl-CoA mutase N-terminal domain/subunit
MALSSGGRLALGQVALKDLAAVKAGRDDAAVGAALARVTSEAADPTRNIVPALIAAVTVRATLGEIVSAIEVEFGTYVEKEIV